MAATMMIQPDISPVIFEVGPLAVRWYGVSYLLGFALALMLGRYRAKQPNSGWTADEVIDLIFYSALGLILGARIGYVVFYQMSKLLADPIFLFKIWEGGMSFHGGAIGVMLAIGLFCRRYKKGFFQVTDFTVPLAPLGLFSGRMGNFINGELWGRPTDVPWCMVFRDWNANTQCHQACGDPSPTSAAENFCVALPEKLTLLKPTMNGPTPVETCMATCRHPSQLYEGFLEGLLLFSILWFFSAKSRPRMAVSGAFLLGYGIFRSTVEFFRQPDAHLGYVAFGWVTQGQVLSTPMILAGIALIILAYRMQSVKAAAEKA